MAEANIFGALQPNDLDRYGWALDGGDAAATLYFHRSDPVDQIITKARTDLQGHLFHGRLQTLVPAHDDLQRAQNASRVENFLRSVNSEMQANSMAQQYALWQIGFTSRMICLIADSGDDHDQLQALVHSSLDAINTHFPSIAIKKNEMLSEFWQRAQFQEDRFEIPVRKMMLELLNAFVVLSASASPSDQATIDAEADDEALTQSLAMSGKRYIVKHAPECQLEDLRTYIRRYSPAVIHFSGHGDEQELSFQDGSGKDHGVDSTEFIAALADARLRGLRVVLLSACESSEIAKKIANTVGWAIGLKCSIAVEDGKKFTAHFYGALARGEGVSHAFHLAESQQYSENMGMRLCEGDAFGSPEYVRK